MIHHSADLGLALEAVEQHRLAFHLGMRNLDRHLFAVVQIGGAKDGSHAAAGHDGVNPVMVQGIADFDGSH